MNICPMCSEQEGATAERVALRERVARLEGEVGRWKQEFRSYAVHDDARCEHFGKCQCGLTELLEEALIEEVGVGPAGLEPEKAPLAPGTAQEHDSGKSEE